MYQSEAGERINKRRAVVMDTRLARQTGFESVDASEFFAHTDRLVITAFDSGSNQILLNLGHIC